jgi:hypothetical protein
VPTNEGCLKPITAAPPEDDWDDRHPGKRKPTSMSCPAARSRSTMRIDLLERSRLFVSREMLAHTLRRFLVSLGASVVQVSDAAAMP